MNAAGVGGVSLSQRQLVFMGSMCIIWHHNLWKYSTVSTILSTVSLVIVTLILNILFFDIRYFMLFSRYVDDHQPSFNGLFVSWISFAPSLDIVIQILFSIKKSRTFSFVTPLVVI
ncbi:MAG: hypothetical protein ACOZBL_00375 [Patescibacteria group bacterium]